MTRCSLQTVVAAAGYNTPVHSETSIHKDYSTSSLRPVPPGVLWRQRPESKMAAWMGVFRVCFRRRAITYLEGRDSRSATPARDAQVFGAHLRDGHDQNTKATSRRKITRIKTETIIRALHLILIACNYIEILAFYSRRARQHSCLIWVVLYSCWNVTRRLRTLVVGSSRQGHTQASSR